MSAYDALSAGFIRGVARASGPAGFRVADLSKAQMAVMNARAHGDTRRVDSAEERGIVCMLRLRKAALALDRVLVETGDEDGRRKLVEPALRLAATV